MPKTPLALIHGYTKTYGTDDYELSLESNQASRNYRIARAHYPNEYVDSVSPTVVRFLEHRAGRTLSILRFDTVRGQTGDSQIKNLGTTVECRLILRSLVSGLAVIGGQSYNVLTAELMLNAAKQSADPTSAYIERFTFSAYGSTPEFRDFEIHTLDEKFGPEPHSIRLYTYFQAEAERPLQRHLFAGAPGDAWRWTDLEWDGRLRVTVVPALDGEKGTFGGPFSLQFSRNVSASGTTAVRLLAAERHAADFHVVADKTETHPLEVIQAQPPAWAGEVLGDEVVWLVGVRGLRGVNVLSAWNAQVVARYNAYLATHRGDRPVSWLPDLVVKSGPDREWTALLSVRDTQPHTQGKKGPLHEELTHGGLVHLAPESFAWLVDPRVSANAEPLELHATFPALFDIHGSPLSGILTATSPEPPRPDKLHRAILAPGAAPAADVAEADWPLAALALKFAGVAGSSEAPLRLGAFDLTFSTDPVKSQSSGVWIWFEPERARQSQAQARVWSPHVYLKLALAVKDFAPGSQDVAEIEGIETSRRRPQPVLVALPRTRVATGLSLNIVERAFQAERQQILLELLGQQDVPERDIVVLDTEPLLIVKVGLPALVPDPRDNLLAIWQSDSVEGAAWQLAAQRTGYQLVLPVQAVGEAAVKRRARNEAGDSEEPPPNDVMLGKPADFRFGRPATLTLFTTWRREARGFVEPPTNTRRVFGDASQRAPGAPLVEAAFELLYGMSATIRGREDLLVTELTADLGLLPGLLLEAQPMWDFALKPGGKKIHQVKEAIKNAHENKTPPGPLESAYESYGVFRDRWRYLHLAFARRLGVLAVHPAGTGEAAALTAGVGFNLRATAEIRRPVPTTKPPYDKDGKRAGLDEKDLLPGGADWGFESTEVYESVWRRPDQMGNVVADGGELAALHFSALGGWGYQKASFDKRRTRIISRTAQGRTHFYSLERIGRIGVFWNRAKHVIVYERTVLPGEQFGPVQEGHVGRPLLRKVREFVEILEPERRFPEDGRSVVERGPVRSVRFRSTIIPVDSAWGQDIPGQGWQVPLWNPRAVRTPAGPISAAQAIESEPIHPKPQVDAELAADEASGVRALRAGFSAPQQLRFFTSTRVGDDDRTDLWAAVEGIDYVDRALSVEIDRVLGIPSAAPAYVSGDLDAPLPPPPSVEAGFAEITFSLDRTEEGTNLVAERVTGSAIGAVLTNVTLTRGAPLSTVSKAQATWQRYVANAGKLAELVDEAVERVRAPLLAAKPGMVDTVLRNRLKAEVEELSKPGGPFYPGGPLYRLQQMTAALLTGEVFGPLFKEVKDADLCTPLKRRVVEVLKEANARLQGDLSPRVETLVIDLSAQLGPTNDGKYALAPTAHRLIDGWFDLARLLVTTIRTPVEDLSGYLDSSADVTLVPRLLAVIERFVQAARQQATEDRAHLLAAVGAFEERLLGCFDEIVQRIVRTAEGKLPKAATAVRDLARAARSKIVTELDAARATLQEKTAIDETMLKETYDPLVAFIKKADGVAGIDRKVKNLADDLAERVGAVGDILDVLAEYTDEARAALHEIGPFNSTDAGTAAIRSRLKQWTDGLRSKLTDGSMGSIRDLVNKEIDTLCTKGLLSSFEGLKTTVLLLANFNDPGSLAGRWKSAIDAGNISTAQLDAALRGITTDALAHLDAFAGRIWGGLKELPVVSDLGVLARAPGTILGLVRAFGDSPRAAGLEFNRTSLAYYFDPKDADVLTTPVTALVNRVGRDLKAFGSRLPIRRLAERLVPDLDLPKLDLRQIFPDFAGIRLDQLLPNLKAPEAARRKIKIAHGIDRNTRRAWVEARVEALPVGPRVAMLDLGVVSVSLRSGVFSAEIRIETGADGRSERRATGRIDGDWELGFGGQTLVTFRDTPLTFDDRRGLRFDLRPDRVVLASAISFLDRFTRTLGEDAGGLRVSVLKQNALPVGVEAVLDLAFPPMTYGTFGISGLRLTTGLQLRAYPRFEIYAFFRLGSRREPFTITIFILGGAGWIEGQARYAPRERDLRVDVSIALGASAALGFNFGPIRGGVQLFLGLNAELHTRKSGRSRLDLAIVLLATGSVRVAGLITAGLYLALAVRVEEGKRVVGQGWVEFRVKLGFIRKRFSTSVTYRFVGSAKGKRVALRAWEEDPWQVAAARYLKALV